MFCLLFRKTQKPQSFLKASWLSVFLGFLIFVSCSKETSEHKTTLFLKTGTGFTADGASIPVGGTIRIGVQASGSGSALTYIRIDRITAYDTLVQLDRGIYAGSDGYEADFVFSKDTSEVETWVITVMNADRVLASKSLVIKRGTGTAYGDINYFPSISLGMQSNSATEQFLDVDKGIAYTVGNLNGHEADIDMICYYYITSGLSSPTFTCPGYTAAVAYYPMLNSWQTKCTTLYDYRSTDNNLISIDQFDAAQNDSLLVTAYKPDKVSGNCKYCYTGKVVPFKTQAGKYGLIKVLRADETETGSLEVSVKVQK
ncbi:MAG: hypothetical protein HXX13_10900 [Bacteroidetes bacterium]|nr:hypothetical protein [Bacteroidota bacterium]